jgi:hypothetical protein
MTNLNLVVLTNKNIFDVHDDNAAWKALHFESFDANSRRANSSESSAANSFESSAVFDAFEPLIEVKD